MIKLIPPIAVPIYFVDLFKATTEAIFKKRIKLLDRFKRFITEYSGFKYSITYQSGYMALFCLLKKLKESSHRNGIIMPAYTCPSVFFAVKNAKLVPAYMDTDLESFNNSIDDLKKIITNNTLAIITVSLFGFRSANISQIRQILQEIDREDIVIIEDLSQALGKTDDKRCDQKEYGDCGILSFGRAKMISTINGGAIVFNQSKIFNKTDELCQQRILFNITLLIKAILFSLLINKYFYRLTNLILTRKRRLDPFNLKDYTKINQSNIYGLSVFQLSLGIRMFKRLTDFNRLRVINARFYKNIFKDSKKFVIQPTENNLYLRFAVVFRDKSKLKIAQSFLLRNGIKTSTADYPLLPSIHNFEASSYSSMYQKGSFIASNILTLPTHPGFKANEYENIFNELIKLL